MLVFLLISLKKCEFIACLPVLALREHMLFVVGLRLFGYRCGVSQFYVVGGLLRVPFPCVHALVMCQH